MPTNQHDTQKTFITTREAKAVLQSINQAIAMYEKSANIAAAHGFLAYDIERLKAVKKRIENAK
jgi:hypothetical protein